MSTSGRLCREIRPRRLAVKRMSGYHVWENKELCAQALSAELRVLVGCAGGSWSGADWVRDPAGPPSGDGAQSCGPLAGGGHTAARIASATGFPPFQDRLARVSDVTSHQGFCDSSHESFRNIPEEAGHFCHFRATKPGH